MTVRHRWLRRSLATGTTLLVVGAGLVVPTAAAAAPALDPASAPAASSTAVTAASAACEQGPGETPTECPAADTDGDGVSDDLDLCPEAAGSGTDGCPVDADDDGLPDDADACPGEAGPGDGCPLQRVITTPDGPLTEIQVSRDLNCAVFHLTDRVFYGVNACGTFAAVDGQLYGPRDVPAGSSAGPRETWTPLSQTPVTGTGTAQDPFTVVTRVAAGTSGVQLEQTDTYVVGQATTSTRMVLSSTAARQVTVYRAGDCYFQGSDVGYGTFRRDGGAVGCREGRASSGRTVPGLLVLEWAPREGAANWYEDGYSAVWSRIGSTLPFEDECACTAYIDNGAGLSWSLSLPAGGTAAVGHDLNVLERPVQRGEIPGDADVDGIPDTSGDNCPGVYNPGQEDSDGSGPGDACTVPVAPVLRRASSGATDATLAWDHASGGVTSFTMAFGRAGTGQYEQVGHAAVDRSWHHTGLPAGSSWTYFVAACNNGSCSPWSNAVTVSTTGARAPQPPDDLRLGTTTGTSIQVRWDDRSTDETHFQVARSPHLANTYTVVDVDADRRRYEHTGLATGSRWDYFVRACNAVGCSSWSSFVTGTATGPSADLSLRMTGAAVAVGGGDYSYRLIVTNDGPSTATDVVVDADLPAGVAYKRVTSSESSRDDCRGSVGYAKCSLPSLPSGSTWSVDVTVVPSATQALTLTGRVGAETDDADLSDNGALLGVNTPGIPPVPTVTQTPGNDSVRLTWPQTSGNTTEYNVAYAAAGTTAWTQVAVGRVDRWTHTGLARGATYSYSVQACLSGRCSAWSTARAVSTGVVQVVGLEVTQAVQDWKNSVPLVEGKATVVRAFAESATPVRLTGRLHGTRDGQALSGSPLSPVNAGGDVMLTTGASARRWNLGDSFNFQLPADWTRGDVTLRLEVPGSTSQCTEAAGPTTGDCATTVAFSSGGAPAIRFVSVPWTDGRTTYTPSATQIAEATRGVLATFPAARVTSSTASLSGADARGRTQATSFSGEPALSEVLPYLAAMRSHEGCAAGCRTIYYGLIAGPNGLGEGGLAADIPGSVAVQRLSGVLSFTTAHEVMHVLGRHHAVHSSRPRDARGRLQGDCGEVADTGAPDFPHRETIGGLTRPALGPMTKGVDDQVWGLEVSRLASGNPAVFDPSGTTEIMSYCQLQDATLRSWPSKWTYEGLRTTGFSASSSSSVGALALDEAAAPTRYLTVRGTVDLASGAVDFLPFGSTSLTSAPDAPEPGDHAVVLRDALGAELARQALALTVAHPMPAVGQPVEEPTTGMFLVHLPEPAGGGVYSAELERDGEVIGSTVASATAPTVSITSPSAETSVFGDELTIAWEAADADANPLTASVAYSPDGGQTWRSLGTDVRDTTLVVARDQLPASAAGLVRVQVSDGFLSTTAVSAPFAVADAAPAVTLDGAAEQTVSLDQSAVLSALASDVEDGALSGPALRWSSSLVGELGEGEQLVVAGETLGVGRHTVTITATDTTGNATRRSLLVVVDAGLVPVLDGAGDGSGGGDGGGDGVVPTPPSDTSTRHAATLPAGGRIETSGPAGADGYGVSLRTPVAGDVVVQEQSSVGTAPRGQVLLPVQVDVRAPRASAGDPLELVFRLAAGQLPDGSTVDDLVVRRNGVAVPPCAARPDGAAVADPDPCVASRSADGADPVVVRVLTSAASVWSFTVPARTPGPGPAPCAGVPAAGFRDVPADSAHRAAIDCAASLGIARGTTAASFAPAGPVRRDQMASFVLRTLEAAGLEVPTQVPDAFRDDEGSVHEGAVDRLAAAGIVVGTAPGRYGPADPVNRAQMATFLARAAQAVAGAPLPAGPDAFTDDEGSAHEASIDAVAAAGIARGLGRGSFGPDRTVHRDQMASFLVRLLERTA